MKYFAQLPILLTSVATAVMASPASKSGPSPSRNITATTIAQFSNITRLENLAVRSNGQILATDSAQPDIYIVDPLTSSHKAPNASTNGRLLYSFPNATSVTGIIEVARDVFAVAVGNISFANLQGVVGSWHIYNLDFTKSSYGGQPSVKRVASIDRAGFLDGFEILGNKHVVPPSRPRPILATDANAGVIWRIETDGSGKYKVAVNDTLTQLFPGLPFPFSALGVNGGKISPVDGKLYYDNNSGNFTARVSIDQNGIATGPSERFVPYAGDDLIFTKKGDIIMADAVADSLTYITKKGELFIGFTQFAQNGTAAGATAVQPGRTSADCETLYVTTGGGRVVALKNVYQNLP